MGKDSGFVSIMAHFSVFYMPLVLGEAYLIIFPSREGSGDRSHLVYRQASLARAFGTGG